MPEPKHPLKVFLCHASTDKPKVRKLYRYLKRRGINPWFDEEHLVGGQDWQVEIPKALATSDAIIICLTKNSVDKEGYIQKEIKFALDKALEMPEGRIFLIPVKFEECEVPFTLSRYQWVDLTVESGYAKMMKALKFRASQLERSTIEVSKKDIIEDEYLVREKKELERIAREVREKQELETAEKVSHEKDVVKKVQLETEEQSRQKASKEKAEREKSEKEWSEIQEQARQNSQKTQPKYKLSVNKSIAVIAQILLAIISVSWLVFSFLNPVDKKSEKSVADTQTAQAINTKHWDTQIAQAASTQYSYTQTAHVMGTQYWSTEVAERMDIQHSITQTAIVDNTQWASRLTQTAQAIWINTQITATHAADDYVVSTLFSAQTLLIILSLIFIAIIFVAWRIRTNPRRIR